MNSEQSGDLTVKGPAEDELVVKIIIFFLVIIFSTPLEDVIRYFPTLMTFRNLSVTKLSALCIPAGFRQTISDLV